MNEIITNRRHLKNDLMIFVNEVLNRQKVLKLVLKNLIMIINVK